MKTRVQQKEVTDLLVLLSRAHCSLIAYQQSEHLTAAEQFVILWNFAVLVARLYGAVAALLAMALDAATVNECEVVMGLIAGRARAGMPQGGDFYETVKRWTKELDEAAK